MEEQKKSRQWSLYDRWQERWTTGGWTRTLIPDIQKWVLMRHRETDFFLAQFQTGHRAFKSSLLV